VAIHPREDLAKTGYKPDMKNQNFNHPSTSLATKCVKPKYKKFGNFYYFLSVTFGD